MKKEVRYFAQDGENIFYLSSSVCAVLSRNSAQHIYNQKYQHQIWREFSLSSDRGYFKIFKSTSN